jgi:protein SCO1/2
MKYAICVLALLAGSCAHRQPELPVYGQVPPFELTAQSGRPFTRQSVDGKIWVADFVFTTCMGPCPRLSSKMRQLQTSLAQMPDVKLVSFTVDPAHDTPPVLAEYAKRYRAEDGRWYFLTGPQERLQFLTRDVFKLGDTGGALIHSTRFVLLDRRSRIRGYYGTEEGTSMDDLLKDVRRLKRESI